MIPPSGQSQPHRGHQGTTSRDLGNRVHLQLAAHKHTVTGRRPLDRAPREGKEAGSPPVLQGAPGSTTHDNEPTGLPFSAAPPPRGEAPGGGPPSGAGMPRTRGPLGGARRGGAAVGSGGGGGGGRIPRQDAVCVGAARAGRKTRPPRSSTSNVGYHSLRCGDSGSGRALTRSRNVMIDIGCCAHRCCGAGAGRTEGQRVITGTRQDVTAD